MLIKQKQYKFKINGYEIDNLFKYILYYDANIIKEEWLINHQNHLICIIRVIL